MATLARRKPTLVVHDNKVRIPTLTNHGDRQAARWGDFILRGIQKSPLLSSEADYFTREALLVHFANSSAFGRVSTITRYRMVLEGVSWLLDQGALIRPNNSRVNLCLPVQTKRAVRSLKNPVPLHLRYYEHIQMMLRGSYELGAAIGVMSLVWLWTNKYDHAKLTEDNMRIIARQTLRAMTKADLLRENTDYTYTTLPPLYEKEEG